MNEYKPNCKHCNAACCRYFIEVTNSGGPSYASDVQQRLSHLSALSDKIFSFALDRYTDVTVIDDPCKYLKDNVCTIHDSPDFPVLCRDYPFGSESLCDIAKKVSELMSNPNFLREINQKRGNGCKTLDFFTGDKS